MRFLLLIFLLFSTSAWALDNPYAPDYVAEFEARIAPLENDIDTKAMTTADFAIGYTVLNEALDRELDAAFSNIMAKLPDASREKLALSQQQWLVFRDAELIFIAENFNSTDFGSSSTISRGGYRAAIVKARIKELLWYLRNY